MHKNANSKNMLPLNNFFPVQKSWILGHHHGDGKMKLGVGALVEGVLVSVKLLIYGGPWILSSKLVHMLACGKSTVKLH